MKIVEYKVVSCDISHPNRLSYDINNLIDAGYVLYGQPVCGANYIAQAMVKYEEPTRSVAVEIKPPHPAD